MITLYQNLLWHDGFYILMAILLIGLIGFFFFKPIFYMSLGLLLFSFYFFRNPHRICQQSVCDKAVLVCPSDGKVVAVEKNLKDGNYSQKVSIFLSPLDVHVNWTPIEGTVEEITYRPGKFMMAFLPKSSELNERNDLLLRHQNGKTIIVRQIAGTIARRICCWVNEHENLPIGSKYGMIRFGSRVEVLLPSQVEILVNQGQKVYGGQTVLGRWTCPC